MDAWLTILEASGHGCLADSFGGFSHGCLVHVLKILAMDGWSCCF